ncbi:MAG: cytochrome b/b6 domain-containing protein [Phenylobacterium sp.]|uniref:cytochrome b/b6 domain-containing protein n=1 Tax=Phenylobacterium sp. TaxID=1871053 RepID=UPI001B54B641|nr:cytochrome b/b6 domain-containing protein [Phenylobacterium sp.]MBP7817628.1 cytochrome b/b6 domain-containing protein [Phenylobacterium sp.]MBP9754770.1 cytochrome b/b6 domain-containing protein [Phenylobacterium sp.]
MSLDKPLAGGRLLVFRHPAVVRITHWVNLASLVLLLLSGLQILCSHPAFYWGETARFAEPFAAIVSEIGNDGEPRGRLIAPGVNVDTTGLLGASKNADGLMTSRAIPHWLTLPGELDLGAGRRWHFFFAWLFVLNGALYLATGLLSRRLQRELVPSRDQLAHIGQAVRDHLRLRFARGEEARRYNVLQKLTYLPVVFGLLPLMVLTGLAMSPAVDARLHLAMVLGGRQTARTLHFLCASGLVAFVVVHVGMVILAGPVNELRSMITGWFVIKPAEEDTP